MAVRSIERAAAAAARNRATELATALASGARGGGDATAGTCREGAWQSQRAVAWLAAQTATAGKTPQKPPRHQLDKVAWPSGLSPWQGLERVCRSARTAPQLLATLVVVVGGGASVWALVPVHTGGLEAPDPRAAVTARAYPTGRHSGSKEGAQVAEATYIGFHGALHDLQGECPQDEVLAGCLRRGAARLTVPEEPRVARGFARVRLRLRQ